MLIPHRHRKTRFIAWVKVFLAYLAKIKDDLYQYWDETILDASMSPQILYLERLLNLRYDRTDIYIGEGYSHGPWVFTIAQPGTPEFYMDQEDDSWVYTYNDASGIDFVVHIPAFFSSVVDVPRIAAIVHKYKLPGKRFIIQKDL
ncbi:MAG: hypothetical protein NTW16_04230 [Bacteroidetes bacterium]|nr:hypothetical protein [Bacteroidota bacterium]